MNVYDFDGTIYDGDATVGFILYTLRHHPTAMLKALPEEIVAVVLYLFGDSEKTRMKARFFSFLRYLENVDKDVEDYWNLNQHRIKKWYLEQQKDTDVIISASPKFILEDICARLNIRNVIATRMDKHTGEIRGRNCKGPEKVFRYYDAFPHEKIDNFYSDHESDRYLAGFAKRSYLVKRNKLVDWDPDRRKEKQP